MKYYVVYQYVGEHDKNDYHVEYDWACFSSQKCRDKKHAFQMFWLKKENGYYNAHYEHKRDFKIIDVKALNEEEAICFRNDYWQNIARLGYQR